MAIRRTDIDIIIPSATYQQKNDIPVWDAYIEKVVIDGDIPSLISDRLCGGIKSMINGYPQKFSGQLKGNIENLLNETEVSIYKKYGITYSKLRVKRDGYYLLISTNGLSENKPYITRCSQCGKIFINPYYKDPVSESWEKNPPTQIVD